MKGFAAPTTLVFVVATAALGGASAARAEAPGAVTPAPGLEALDLEQLMRIEVVFAGSKREQQTRDVPSYVSVVTAAEIAAHGYRTLADVLKTLPSFYVSNDRNYTYLGVRGFLRPGDYSSRVLLLLNGLRTNDNIYDQASIGEEGGFDLDLVERIEVIRGPSAALYGSNAFFAVINIVTRRGASLQGGEIATSAASFGTYAGRASYGRQVGNADFLLSASYSDGKGRRLYFPEFDSPLTNDGVAEDADRERFHRLFASASKGDFTFQAEGSSREKRIPTGSYGTVFNDPRNRTVDGTGLASLAYDHTFQGGTSFSTRIHGGRWTYDGAYTSELSRPPARDEATGEWWGLDVDATRRLRRHFLSVGAEFRDDFRQEQKTYDVEPFAVYTDVTNRSTRFGLFAQDEIQIVPALILYAGIRFDRYETFGSATSPRVGLIYTPDPATTVKLLAGRAFRAPNEFELHYESSLYRASPGLDPERISTLELVAQRLVGGGVRVSASAFRNRLSALVSQFTDASDGDRLAFRNADEIDSKGIELGVEVNRGHGATGRISYALQRTDDRLTGAELTNSPRHLAQLELIAPMGKSLSAGLDTQYVSGRRTLAGNTAPAYTVANLSLLAPRVFGRIAVSATIYNLLDARYGVPGSEEHLQDVIAQDGRSFRVKTTLRF